MAKENAMTGGKNVTPRCAGKAEGESTGKRGTVSDSRTRWATLREYARAIGSAVLIALLVRQFVFQAFRIPSGSMRNTLLVGDFLFVNKFLFGAKTPKRVRILGATLVSHIPYVTLPALRQPRQGDIIVFEWPEDPTQDYIKRCVGVAGDLVEVREGVLKINGSIYESNFGEREGDHSCIPEPGLADRCAEPRTLRVRQYRRLPSNVLDPTTEFGLSEGLQIARNRSHLPHLREQFVAVAAAALERGLFPDPAAVREHVAALVATQADDEEIPYGRRRAHEDAILAAVAGQKLPYVIPEGHIFMMGDNRFNSLDSRVWGALDTDLIRGKALFIYFSWNPDRKLPRVARVGDIIR